MSATPSRNRLLPIVGLVLVVGFLTTNVLSYLVSANALRTAIIEHELPLTGNNVLAEVEKDLVRPILVSSLMANDTFVQDWLKNGEADVGHLREVRALAAGDPLGLVNGVTRDLGHVVAVGILAEAENVLLCHVAPLRLSPGTSSDVHVQQ